MKISQCKTLVLYLLDEMKINTSRADYLQKFFDYLDIAQKKVCQTKPIIKTQTINKTASNNTFDMVELNSDVYEINRLYDSNLNNVEYIYLNNKIALPGELSGTFTLEYKAYPVTITSNTSEDTELEIEEDAAQAIPYFVSALLVIKEDDKRPYETYMEQFDSIMTNLSSNKGPAMNVKVSRELF